MFPHGQFLPCRKLLLLPKIWGGRWGSNPRPPESQSGALPTELRPPLHFTYSTRTRTCNPRLRRPVLYPVELRALHKNWSGWRDSNSRPTAPKAVALPGCATPRQGLQPGNVTDLDRIRQRLISKKNPATHEVFLLLARPERFELPTFWFVARHSIQLSYGRINTCHERLLRGQRIILLKRSNVNSRGSLSLLEP
jgi:hypothetical protein